MQQFKRVGWSFLWSVLLISTAFISLGHSRPPVHADGGEIYVAPVGEDTPTCGPENAPCRTIAFAAENRAGNGAVILVAAGVYTEKVIIEKPGLQLHGAGPDQTIIDGENVRGPLVVFRGGLTQTTVFSGFRVQNGNAQAGGAIYLIDSNPILQGLTVYSNTGQDGGGLYLDSSSPTLNAVTVMGNQAAGQGGGIYLNGNANPRLGGNVVCANSQAQLYNNTAAEQGAAGIWWGTNTPQTGADYGGPLTIDPPLTIDLAVVLTGSTDLPGGTGTLDGEVTARLSLSMVGGDYAAPPGTQLTLLAQGGYFAGRVNKAELTLVEGLAGTVFTPTTTGLVTIAVFHPCDPDNAASITTFRPVRGGQQLYLPIVQNAAGPDEPPTDECPDVSLLQYDLIPVPGTIDHPDYLHGDLNLARRGYDPVAGVSLTLIDLPGGTSGDPPQLPALFADRRLPAFKTAYQVNDWLWDCGVVHGCPGDPLTRWQTTLIGMETNNGETIAIPTRNAEIYRANGHSYRAIVLYAEEKRITLGYLREDSVANGYSVHLENLCVDPNLLTLYRAQVGPDGYRSSQRLPALTNGQTLGTALGTELRVAVRDRGTFMDPRSRKDWWQGK